MDRNAADLDHWFGAGSAAADVIDDYRPRESQRDMARRVLTAIDTGGDLMVEAGTGTGKTLAYLLPLLAAGKRAIVSTGTKTLQDQLWRVDLPRVRRMTGATGRFALLKGRSNYVCPHRLDRYLAETGPRVDDEMRARLVEVRQWASQSRSGDLGEIMDTEAEAGLLPLVTSTADNCLGRECGRIDDCPVYKARARAGEADIVVVNHHLLFSDLAMNDEAVAPLLPHVDVVVMDEAHQAASVARQFFGYRLSSGQLFELVRDIDIEFRALGGEDVMLAESTRYFDRCVQALNDAWREVDLDAASTLPAADRVESLDLAFAGLLSRLEAVRERSRGYQQCYQRTLRFADLFTLLTDAEGESGDHARWLERTRNGFSLHLAPVSIAAPFGDRVRASQQSWILTSATLSVGGSFDHAVTELGLEGIDTAHFPSPFDFASQVSAWIPPLVAAPGTSEHTAELIEHCLPLLAACTGRTFMLFTTYRALRQAASMLAEYQGLNCLVQGTASRARLLEQFRQIDGAVLLATQSFWEGVDVRGGELRLLIVDKLPFPSPEQPLTRARTRAIEAAGGNGFSEHYLPEAITRLRQGFGRLIREENDAGLFVLGDTRVRTRRYGPVVLDSLPPVRWLDDAECARAYLASLV